MHPWDLLGMEPTGDVRAIKRAYSVKLKTTRPDDDAEAYQALRGAYESAQFYAKHHANYEMEDGEQELTNAPAAEQAVAEVLPEAEAEAMLATPTVEAVLADCSRHWSLHGSMGLAQVWPRLLAQLEDMPIAEHNRASRALAQFVVTESGLPIDVLIGLTRHFQWGLDFRVDQLLGPHLSHALQHRLQEEEVYAAFRPERYAHHGLALALARLWDAKHRFLLFLLSVCLDCHARHRVLQARPSTLHVLGASRASVSKTQRWIANGGILQGGLFVLLVGGALYWWHQPDNLPRLLAEMVLLAVASGVLFFPFKEFPGYRRLLDKVRRGHNLDWVALIPVVGAVLTFMDLNYAWLGGFAGTPQYPFCMVVLYVGIWMLTPTRDAPWHLLVLPTFALLLFGVLEFVPAGQFSLALSLAFAWTLGAHMVLRRYPQHFENGYAALIKLGFVRAIPIYILGFKFIGVVWAVAAIAILPILLFRMAVHYRVLYAGAAMFAGALLGHSHQAGWENRGMLIWVLAAVFCIQIFQTASQRLADYGLKKLGKS